MPKRVFHREAGDRRLCYQCETCKRLHGNHEDAAGCEHGHIKMLAYEQMFYDSGGKYPDEIHAAFADGTIIEYRRENK